MSHHPGQPESTKTVEKLRRAPASDGLLIVGLVGRAGSGKSTVAAALAERGARVLDADRLGHEVTDADPAVREALLREYGPAVYLDDGRLNRRLVAAKVFADGQALERLNTLVHPRILRRLRERLAALPGEGYRGPVVVDAALMLDWAFERDCDAVVAVVAPEAEQVARLVRARGWSEGEALRRLAAQRTNESFAAAADEVIENAGSEAELAAASAAALERLARKRAARDA
jgi:dephospho-CoA kinase